MKNIKDIKDVLDYVNSQHESRKAVEIKMNELNKNINFYNLRFDIYALAISIKRLQEDNTQNIVAILSENRYEWQITYLANSLLKNTIVIIPIDLDIIQIENIIKKYEIKTIFYSKINEEKITEIYNKIKKNKTKNLNLINFDSQNNPNVINYEKMLNTGRYIENSRENKIENYNTESKVIIINESNDICIYNNNLIEYSLKVKKYIHLWNFIPRRIIATKQINNFYEIIIEILLPMLLGLNITYSLNDCKKSDIYIQTLKNNCEIYIRKRTYILSNIENEFKIIKEVKRKENKNIPKFQVISNNNPRKIECRNNTRLVLIKDNKVGI